MVRNASDAGRFGERGATPVFVHPAGHETLEISFVWSCPDTLGEDVYIASQPGLVGVYKERPMRPDL